MQQLTHYLLSNTHTEIKEIVYHAVFWLSCFQHNSEINPKLSPSIIVKNLKLYFTKHCKLQFVTYVQVHEQHKNSLMPRTVGALELLRAEIAQGSYSFLTYIKGNV